MMQSSTLLFPQRPRHMSKVLFPSHVCASASPSLPPITPIHISLRTGVVDFVSFVVAVFYFQFLEGEESYGDILYRGYRQGKRETEPSPPLPPFPPSLLRAPAVLACMEEKEEKTVASGRRCRIERYIR